MRAISPGALLVVYLLATGAVLALGASRVRVGDLLLHAALLLVLCATSWLPRVPAWLRLWAPLLALPALYAELPAVIAAAGHEHTFDASVIAWEHSVFGGQPALELAARWPAAFASEALHAAYVSYYGIIFAVPAVLQWQRRDDALREATLVLMLTFVACFAAYAVFPVAGPRYLWPAPAGLEAGPFRALALWLLDAGSSRGTAFPSSHVAVAVTQSLLAWRYLGFAGGLPIAALSAGLAFGAIYGGFHYAIDVVAGAALGAALTILALRRLDASTRRAHANATAPT